VNLAETMPVQLASAIEAPQPVDVLRAAASDAPELTPGVATSTRHWGKPGFGDYEAGLHR